MRRVALTVVVALLVVALRPMAVVAQEGRGRGAAARTARESAPFELTGYWVSVVSEDWRYRMVTPTLGDYQGVPMTDAATAIADAWDPEADEAAGNQCKSYGAAAIMRVPGRLRFQWEDDETLRLDADAGTQTRRFRFGDTATSPAEPSWQGESSGEWQVPQGRGRGAPAGPPRTGSLKVVTTHMRAGYLRKNGVPYSDGATLTEYFNVVRYRNGDEWLVVTSVVEDPEYLRQPFHTSTQFKRQADETGWNPTSCSSTW